MNVNVRLFASLRELVGQGQVSLELPEAATVAVLHQHLSQEYPAIRPYLETLACAVADEYVPGDYRLHDGDDVALIPPVSGGSGALFLVTTDVLDANELMDAVRTDESGAVVLFYGVARNSSDGRTVIALEYDAHAELAEKKLREVADDVSAKFPISRIGAHHRTGRLSIGETSLLVAVSSPHRKEAFDAAHYAVDRIKQIVPVWKKEIWEDGTGEWVAGYPVQVAEGTPTS